MAAGIRVLLADDQRVVREGLGTLLGLLDGIELVATAADGEEAVALAVEHRPDVVLMDLRMPRMDGTEAIKRLAAARHLRDRPDHLRRRRVRPRRPARRRPRLPHQGRRRRADPRRGRGRRPRRGGARPAIQHHVLAAVSAPSSPRPPTTSRPREVEVLTLIAEGLTNAEIAERLVVSAATVKSHVNHIFAKIGARDRAQAVVYAYANGLTASR